MLWLKVKIGESVYIGDSTLTLVAKDRHGIDVRVDGKYYVVDRGDKYTFPTFTLHAGDNVKGLRLGFDAPKDIIIRRENA